MGRTAVRGRIRVRRSKNCHSLRRQYSPPPHGIQARPGAQTEDPQHVVPACTQTTLPPHGRHCPRQFCGVQNACAMTIDEPQAASAMTATCASSFRAHDLSLHEEPWKYAAEKSCDDPDGSHQNSPPGEENIPPTPPTPHGVGSHPVPVALVGECSIPVVQKVARVVRSSVAAGALIAPTSPLCAA